MKENNIITHAPIQVREDTLNKHERMLSLLTAESINNLTEAVAGTPSKRIDIWNTLNLKQDSKYTDNIERSEDITKLIDARYKVLEHEYNIIRDKRLSLRDDGADYQNIIKCIIDKLIKENIFQVCSAEFHCCEKCDYVIAPIDANIKSCSMCQSEKLGRIEKRGMFMNVNHELIPSFESLNYNALSVDGRARVKSALLNMPMIMQISKQRKFGLSLNDFGVDDDFVLDPKIAIALAGKVIREMGLGEIAILVQGTDTLKNNVPFSLLLDPNSKTKFLNIGLIPSFSTPELEKFGSMFYFPFLSLVMASKSDRLSENELVNLQKQFTQTQRKLSSCIVALDRLTDMFTQSNENFNDDVDAFFIGLMKLLEDYKLRDAVQFMRSFIYDNLSKKYIVECRHNGTRPSSSVLELIENILNLVYKVT